MTDNNSGSINKKAEKNEKEKKKHHPPHDLPPHILKEIMDLKEKVGKLQGQMEVLLSMKER